MNILYWCYPYQKLFNSPGVIPNLDFALALPEKQDFLLRASQIATVGQLCNTHQRSIKGDKCLLKYLQLNFHATTQDQFLRNFLLLCEEDKHLFDGKHT